MSSIPSENLQGCSICLEKIEKPRILTCNHILHNSCAVTWFNASILNTETPSCPECRADQRGDKGIQQVNQLAIQIIDENTIAARYLLTRPMVQANINLLTLHDRQPALYRAVDADNRELIEPLLDIGANVSIRAVDEVDEEDGKLGFSSLNLACFREPETLDLILGNSTPEQLNEVHDEYGTSLSLYLNAAFQDESDLLFGLEDEEILNVVNRLLTAGADINLAIPQSGTTPLHEAIFYERGRLVQFFLENGANPSTPNLRGQTPLMLAIMTQRVDMIWMLLNKGASIAVPSEFSLHQFAEKNFSELARAIPDQHKDLAQHPAISRFINNRQCLDDLNAFVTDLDFYYAQDPFTFELDISKNGIPGAIAPFPPLFLAILTNKVHLVWRLISDFNADIFAKYQFAEKVVLSPFEFAQKLNREHLVQDGYQAVETTDDLSIRSQSPNLPLKEDTYLIDHSPYI